MFVKIQTGYIECVLLNLLQKHNIYVTEGQETDFKLNVDVYMRACKAPADYKHSIRLGPLED